MTDAASRRVAERLGRLAAAVREARDTLTSDVAVYAGWAVETLEGGGRVLFCGNGGSSTTIEHAVAEYVVRFRRERQPLPAIALTSSVATITAAANDFGYEQVFVRPLRALAGPGDLLVVHSTSGSSPNCLAAARAAREMGLRTVALTGSVGGELAEVVDLALRAPSGETATIQEIHLAIEHAVVDHVDAHFAGEET